LKEGDVMFAEEEPHNNDELFKMLGRKLFEGLGDDSINELSDAILKLKKVNEEDGIDDSLKIVKLGFGK